MGVKAADMVYYFLYQTTYSNMPFTLVDIENEHFI